MLATHAHVIAKTLQKYYTGDLEQVIRHQRSRQDSPDTASVNLTCVDGTRSSSCLASRNRESKIRASRQAEILKHGRRDHRRWHRRTSGLWTILTHN